MRKIVERNHHPVTPDLTLESALWEARIRMVAGIDEAGRGALAGPVAAAAVTLPEDLSVLERLHGVRDSKQMTPGARQVWSKEIKRIALTWSVGFASAQEIDQIGIVPATRLAVQRALAELSCQPEHLLLDYLFLPECSLPQTALVKGDARCLSIASASILAKTARDDLLIQFDQTYPGYGLAANKGYGTAQHRQAIVNRGLTAIHRQSFQIKAL